MKLDPNKAGRVRLTEKEVEFLLWDEHQSGYTELARELHRARRSEAALLKALKTIKATIRKALTER